MPEPSPLDEVFGGILNDESLQVQVKQAQEQQAREQEAEWGKPIRRIGSAYFAMLSHPDDVLPDDLKSIAGGLGSATAIYKPNKETGLLPEKYKERYLEQILGHAEVFMKKDELEIGARMGKQFLYGFGNAALEARDINTALVILDKGGWLDDQYIGQSLQIEITEKVQTLDPKAKVEAAMTWKKIQEAKTSASGPILTIVPPTS
ncbi:hypothetical protein A3B45_01285 [Candidatus Daviesbacteria bacterium RIFCSPLOWO2_01_FULL_39_12]|uniref:Uncharacterized protein n=1 Tax=Candidatus Daviesbacteria bacterium RIFCSPLOWO2_01_FULL_39_12 TaxID=1797785 RepID=A0A1F5KR94_9BACT|nr:MAG: hypothetical protein A3D79_00465 [Candidatus Daviesbacteria bacterium RIFCSPHIGHO2_02_FULL_39_8]OGE43151.1 MAG: hypothetical protein A3B45_01285 [Candidatus Daviesbacteria bacterium RIFCSPLOWO2_01_FULL_39_12]